MTAAVLVLQRTAIYRFYNADGALLYVGITNDIITRWSWHRRHSAWWKDHDRAEVSWCPDRATADALETAAIRTENPLHNIAKRDRASTEGRFPPEVQEMIDLVVSLAEQRDEAEAEYRGLLNLAVNEHDVPVTYMAEQLGVERKTVYRHTGRAMS